MLTYIYYGYLAYKAYEYKVLYGDYVPYAYYAGKSIVELYNKYGNYSETIKERAQNEIRAMEMKLDGLLSSWDVVSENDYEDYEGK